MFKSKKTICCLLFLMYANVCSIGQNLHELKSTIDVLSWNIQMLPDLYSPFSSYVRKKQTKRLPEIISYLKNSDFDIVVLQEVFDVQMKNKLAKQLVYTYPYIQLPIKKGIGIKLSNGIMILSKFPIDYKCHTRFEDSEGTDKMAQKGCVLISVNINNEEWLIAGTHLNSTSQKIRDLQYAQIQKTIIKPYITDKEPFILAGDLNTSKNTSSYAKMMELFQLRCPELNEQRPFTYDSKNSWNQANYNVWIDYLLHNLNEKNILKHYIIRPTMVFKNKTMDLADHYGIALKIAID